MRERVIAIAAVPAHKSLNAIAISHNQSRRQHHFCRVLQVALGDEIFQAVDFADGNRQHQHHGEPGIDSAGHEVRWKDCGMPARDDADGEIETHDRMDREHKRRG